jgi:hypothetical protein
MRDHRAETSRRPRVEARQTRSDLRPLADGGRSSNGDDARMDERRRDTAAPPIRVALAVPHARTRAAIGEALEATDEIVIAAEAMSAADLPRVARAARAQVVLIDLALLGRGTPFGVTDLVQRLVPATVVTIGLLGGESYVRAALEAGATAHLLTDAPAEDYRAAVLRAAGSTGG